MRWVKMEMAEGEVGVCPSSLSSALFSRKREAHFFFLLTSQFYSKEIRKYFSDAGFVRIWVRVRIKPEKKILIRPNLGPICPSNIRHKRYSCNQYSRETFWSLKVEWAILTKSFHSRVVWSWNIILFRNILRSSIRHGITFLNYGFIHAPAQWVHS